MPIEDVEMTRMVRREISRRYVDCTSVDIRVMHGVVYLRGFLKKLKGHDSDLDQEMETILRILRQKPGIREVISELELGGPGLRDYVKSSQRDIR
ncbi:MAG: BON domain-containing protein [Armatimonadota bacterium]